MFTDGALVHAAIRQPRIADFCGHGPPLYGESVPATWQVFMPTVCPPTIGSVTFAWLLRVSLADS
jgi:hypothetical protein